MAKLINASISIKNYRESRMSQLVMMQKLIIKLYIEMWTINKKILSDF